MDRNTKRPGLERVFSLRNISNLIMILAVMVALVPGRNLDSGSESRLNELEARNTRFLIRLARAQVISLDSASPEEQKMALQEIDNFFQILEDRENLDRDRIRLEKVILESHLGRIADRPAFMGEDPVYSDFRTLYEKNEPLPDSSPLFTLELGDLARLRSYRISEKTEEMEALHGRLAEEALQTMGVLFLFTMGALALFLGSFVFGIVFFFKRTSKRTEAIPSVLTKEEASAFFDSAVLYLFLAFPVAKFVMSQAGEMASLSLSLAILPVLFLFVFFLFLRITGISLKSIFTDRKDTGILKEVLWGFIGFVAIFPVAFLSTVATINLSGVDAGNARFAHPIVFSISENPWTIFLFAVFIVPIVEETVFRYWFYGFFRKYSGPISSAFVTGTIFAILHPQGWIALPYLTVLGMGLALLREYRNSLIPSIVTHAIVNALAIGGTLFFYQFTA